MYKLDFHADDYAISMNNSKRLLELIKAGKLDSISIVANMSCYDECMELLKSEWNSLPVKPLLSVHINLIDGLSCSGDFEPTDSWTALFRQNFRMGASSREYKARLTGEIRKQISKVYTDIRDLEETGSSLRLDSHVHTHMIPMVFDAMMDACKDIAKPDFVRISKEPLLMFFTTKGVVGTLPPANLMKNVVLRLFAHRAQKKLEHEHIDYGFLWGLNMSGMMDSKRMKLLMPKMKKYAQKRNAYLEILGHPGIVLEEEKLPEYGSDDMKFFFSQNRNIEYDAMVNCHENTVC